jgi:hypothetical protein
MAYVAQPNVSTGDLATAAEENQTRANIASVKSAVGGDGCLQGYKEKTQAAAISAGVVTVDVSLGNHILLPLNANITSFTFTNVPATGFAFAVLIYFTADGVLRSVTHTINTHAVKFAGGSTFVMTSTAGKIDKILYTTTDGGVTWMGDVIGQSY